MQTDILIGVDMGSTGLKVLAFECGSGATLACAGGPLHFIRLPGGGCELAEAHIRLALFQALRSVAQQLGPRVHEVRALGCTGHGAGLYALDDGRRLLRGVAVASTDQRASQRARALAAACGEALYQEVGSGPWSGQPSMIAAELIELGLLRRGQIRQLLFAKDFLGLLLCGELCTDSSDASTAGLMNLDGSGWSHASLEAAGLSELADALPPLRPSASVRGQLRASVAADCGLPAGLPVAVGCIDLLASLQAVGAPARGEAVAVLGTWCVNAVVGPVQQPRPALGALVNFGEPGRLLCLENSPSSMANLGWLLRQLQFPNAAAALDAAFSLPLGAEGLRYLPFINGGGDPPNASAGFVGLQSHHQRAHMARALVDAVMAQHARHLKRLAACGLGLPNLAAALGGGARDARMVQLMANFLGHAVERCGDDETGARGAALDAARALGWRDVLPTATEPGLLPVHCTRLEPQPDATGRHAAYLDGFEQLLAAAAPLFAHLAGNTP
ncbi:FGGY family carbohydrate kinase [Roseateles amylovorans]|uniref:FGGY family carbohydrate kinase n=1 Tax=Roseateles amylovorans TaxID=2978473 RepID=A0ABY6B588_9BURK|nr:FGGY family carbohydrate kinase [Roseateles amylovorans]UXH80012.1 FGGY family carbohydrate kinase [Roseateles amylovorans]